MDVIALDKNLICVEQFSDFISLIWTERFNECGDFSLEFIASKDILEKLYSSYYFTIKMSTDIMVIESIETSTDLGNGDKIIVKGRSLKSILERRIVWGVKTLSGSLHDSIKSLINDNIIAPTDNDRKIDNFVYVDSEEERLLNLTIEDQYSGESLYEIISTLAKEESFGFNVYLDSSNRFVFSLYDGVDRSFDQIENPYVVFSEDYQNLKSMNVFTSSQNYKNVTLIGGEGEGSAKTFTSYGSGIGLDRREIYTDASGSSKTTESGTISDSEYISILETKGKEKIEKFKMETAYEGEFDTSTVFVLGKDFFVGDIVQLMDEYDNSAKVRIMEMVISENEEGLLTYPTFVAVEEKKEENNT